MIKNIIFDFGDIFINLDKKRFADNLDALGIKQESKDVQKVLQDYEMGLMTSDEFVAFFYQKLDIAKEDFVQAWNSILLDFPLYRLRFLKDLVKTQKYRIFLLSNTNYLHISWIQNSWGMDLYHEFKKCFEHFYLSQEIHFRKPNAAIFDFVLKENNLTPKETLFIDDTKENIITAKSMGMHVWHLIPGEDEVTQLFTKKANLF